MRAAVYRGVDRVEVEELPVPEIGAGEILVRVHTCGVCGTDLKKIHHGLVPPPRVFGHETAGMVAAVSAGETEWRVGDRVVVQHHVPCGDCFYCRRRLYASCPGYARTGVTPASSRRAEASRNTSGCCRSSAAASSASPTTSPLKKRASGAAEHGPQGRADGGRGGRRARAGDRAGTDRAAVHAGTGGRGALGGGDDLLPFRREMARSLGAEAVDPEETDVAALCRERTRAGERTWRWWRWRANARSSRMRSVR
jgi:hypothetical protein